MGTAVSRTVNAVTSGNGKIYSIAPAGSFFNGTKKFSTTSPTVTLVTAQDTLPAIGSPVTISFTSDQPGFWELASDVPGAILSETSDGLSCDITFTPAAYPICSIYVAARCKNAGGTDVKVCRVHPGMTGVKIVGPNAGADYPDLYTAFAAVKAYADPYGYCFVVQNGTYTSDNMHMYYDGNTGSLDHLPPTGEFTVDNSGTDPVYTINRWTSVITETPFGVILDGQGTRDYGIYIRGNTHFESDQIASGYFVDNQAIQASGADRRGIHVAGFVVNNVASVGAAAFSTDHVFFEYLFIGAVSTVNIPADANNPGLQIQYSTDCIVSNCHAIGGCRYKHSAFMSKRTRFCRGFERFDTLNTNQPHAGVSTYRGRYTLTQNILHFDSDQLNEFNLANSQDAGFLALPSTNAYDWPAYAEFHKCLLFNSDLGLIENDSRDITTNLNTFIFDNIGAWYYRPFDGNGAGCGISQDGPNTGSNFTLFYCDNSSAAYGANAYRQWQTYTDSIIYRYGYEYDATTGLGINALAASQDATAQYVHFSDSDFFDLSYATLNSGVDQAGVVLTNITTDRDPTQNGMRYPGRLEPKSTYKTLNRGQDNFYLSDGLRGYGYEHSEAFGEVGVNWLAEAMLELALPHYQSFSYTGDTNTQGTITISGNRLGALDGKEIIDYIISRDGKDVPFPLSVRVSKIGSKVRISWRLFASDYMTNISSWDVLTPAGMVIENCTTNIHSVDLDGLISGKNYTFVIRANDSVLGTSGLSYEVNITV